jgi:hypothetical protein
MSRIPNPSDLTLLPDLAGEIATITGHPCPKSYAQLLRMINDGKMPAARSGGRYSVNVHTAIEVLGLTVEA